MGSETIFHIDVNSAYLSWSAIRRLQNGDPLDLRTIPSIIGGDKEKRHGIVLAKSIPAKKYGIQTAEPIVSAFRKCPTLVMESPDMHYYHQKSEELMNYLRSVCPDIEQLSVDECFMDYTPIQRHYASPIEAAFHIKDEIRNRFGFTVNVGISDKRVLAKMASDFEKPDKVHTLYQHEIKEKMWPLPVSSLYMCGKSSVQALHNLGIRTIGDLATTDASIIASHLKSHGVLLWQYANGIDDSGVTSVPAQAKGIGNSTTVAKDLTTAKEAKLEITSLSALLKKKNDRVLSESIVSLRYNQMFQASLRAYNTFRVNKQSGLLFQEKTFHFHPYIFHQHVRIRPSQQTYHVFPAGAPVLPCIQCSQGFRLKEVHLPQTQG